jgi:hypothetical protein
MTVAPTPVERRGASRDYCIFPTTHFADLPKRPLRFIGGHAESHGSEHRETTLPSSDGTVILAAINVFDMCRGGEILGLMTLIQLQYAAPTEVSL